MLQKWQKENLTPKKRQEYYKNSWGKKENRDKHRERMKKWRELNPHYMKEWHKNNKEEFNRKFILQEAEAPSSSNQFKFCTAVIAGKTPSGLSR